MWFPNGRRLGYIRERTWKQKLGIESCDLRGESVTTLFSGSWLSDMFLLSDGRILYSIAEQMNRVQSSLWEISTDIETGQARGTPARILTWPGFSVRSLSASQDGKSLAFLKETSQAEVYVGELMEDGRQMNVPQRLTFDDRYDGPAAWTPDSKAVIFSSDRNGNLDIFKQTLGERRAEPIMAGPEWELDPTVSPDGAWILYFALPTQFRTNSTEPVSLKRSPLSGGPAQEVLHDRGFARISCALRPSSRCVVDQRIENQLRFYSFDALQGKGQELARIEINPSVRDYWWDLSPNGSQIVFTTAAEQGRIRILSLTERTSSEVQIVAAGWSDLMGAGWSADGKGWFVTGRSGGSEALLHVDQDGHAQVLWQQPISNGGLWAVPSPDSRYLAFPASTSTCNAWMIENF
jgi:eukaryotic-like serine/threonine-protein kinase